MAKQPTTYETMDNPYDNTLMRTGQSNSDINQSVAPVPFVDNGSVEDANVKSQGNLKDVWITTFIKSVNYKPKSVGFYIDGQTGYGDFTNVNVSGEINATSGTIGGWVIGPTTITGGTVTLDSSGSITIGTGNDRIEMIGSDTGGSINIYANGNLSATLDGGVLAFYVPATGLGGGSIYAFGTNQITIDTGDEQYRFDDNFFIDGAFTHGNSGVDIGDVNHFWGIAYVNGVSLQDPASSSPTPVLIWTGLGTPEGSITAHIGSLYLRTDGGATTSLYVKTSGTGNTGWTAK